MKTLHNKNCIFCQIVDRVVPAEIIFENETIITFLDIDPINEGHILIIPKEHYLDLDDLNEEILSEIINISKKVVLILKEVYSPDGYSIMQNGGNFNDIGHFHLHVFPRYQNDGFSWKYRSTKELTNLNLVKAKLMDKI